jgi:NADPH-dependent glutamate synthase beta subunit-like oxidoreductase
MTVNGEHHQLNGQQQEAGQGVSIAIVGAGIGGLAAAVFLLQQGHRVQVNIPTVSLCIAATDL